MSSEEKTRVFRHRLSPIAVPNDGPLARALSRKIEERVEVTAHSNSFDVDDDVSSLSASAILLQQSSSSGMNATDGPYSVASQKVVTALLSSASVREQLSALKAYRSTLLHLSSASNQKVEKQEPDDAVTVVVVGMFRILLELAFSKDSPHAMKRSSLSCVSVLSTVRPNETRVVEKVVVNSVLSRRDASRTVWSDPIQTLFEVLSHPSTQAVVFTETSRGVEGSLRLLRDESEQIRNALLSSHSCENLPFILDTDAVDAAEVGVRIASTLKLLLSPLIAATNRNGDDMVSLVRQLLVLLLLPLVSCRATTHDGLNVVGVVLGQALIYKSLGISCY